MIKSILKSVGKVVYGIVMVGGGLGYALVITTILVYCLSKI